MIGQKYLLQQLKNMADAETLPRFIIIVGPMGAGKKLICAELAKFLNMQLVRIEPKVDDIREMISLANKVTMPTLYAICDADNMSPASKNAMLKVTEEPPNNAYFVMTLMDAYNTLPTIRSRATIYHTDNYLGDELLAYAGKTDYDDIILKVCQTPGEIDLLKQYNPAEFYSYVQKVVDNIAVVSGANSFKIGDKLSFKDDDKYNLKLFFKAFMAECIDRIDENPIKYSTGVRVTSKYLQELRSASVNKQSTFDMWLLTIRKEWMQWN